MASPIAVAAGVAATAIGAGSLAGYLGAEQVLRKSDALRVPLLAGGALTAFAGGGIFAVNMLAKTAGKTPPTGAIIASIAGVLMLGLGFGAALAASQDAHAGAAGT